VKVFIDKFVALIAFGMIAIGCQGPSATRGQITNYEAPGNLESTHSIGCEKTSDLRNIYTPPDLYNGMLKCLDEGDSSSAVYFFALAGTYSYFDMLRVSDRSAHQAHIVLLQRSMGSLEQSKKDMLWEELNMTIGNKDRLPVVCTEVMRIGAPQYYPRYMIQHGLDAVLGERSDDGLIKDFDPAAAWKEALRGYLHCPNL